MLRIALFLFSLANIAAGLGLAGLYLRFRGGGGVPAFVLLIGLALMVQGGFTIGYLRGWWKDLREKVVWLFVAGQSAAALLGTLGTIQGILYNLYPRNGDQEFGPMTAAMLIGVHGAIGLLYAARNERLGVRLSGHQSGNDR